MIISKKTIVLFLIFFHVVTIKYLNDVSILLSYFIFLSFIVKELYIIYPKKIRWPIIIFSLIVLIGLVSFYLNNRCITLYPFRGVLRYCSYLVIFILSYKHQIELNKFIKMLCIILILSIIIFSYEKVVLNISAPHTIFRHSNHFGYFMSFSLIMILSYIKRFYMFLLVLLLSFIIINTSEATGAVLVYSLGGLFLVLNRMNRFKGLIVVMFVIIFSSALYMKKDRIEQLSSFNTNMIVKRIENQSPGGGGSVMWRIVYSYIIINHTVNQKNEIIGNGIGTTSSGSPFLLEPMYTDPHNEYVRVFAEFGIVGLSLYLIAYLIVYLGLFYYKRKYSNNWANKEYTLFYSLLVVICMFNIAQISGNMLTSSTTVWIIMVYTTIVIKKLVKTKKEIYEQK